MTENDTRVYDANNDDELENATSTDLLASHSRRRLLQSLMSGSTLVLAGCGQGDSGTPTATLRGTTRRTPDVSDQTLQVPVTGNAPNKTSFYQLAPDKTFATTAKETPEQWLAGFIWESGMWFEDFWIGADIRYTWLDEIVVTPTEVTVSIRDDARWSDGHPITGTDIAVRVLDSQIRRFFRPFYASSDKDKPSFILRAFDDFDVRDRSVTYKSTPGHFKEFWDWTIKTWFGRSGGSVVPTHIEPYDTYADAVIETVQRAQQGEIEPWDAKPWKRSSAPTRGSLRRKHLNNRKYVYKFSKAENVLASGAWELAEIRGSEAFAFKPNPHHRNADQSDFESVILEYTPSKKRERAALKADRLDYASGVTPQTVVESFPDHIRQLLTPGGIGTGNELGLNFDHPGLSNRKVRMAIMYALDHEAIATNVHQSAAIPVTTPGGDCWDATRYVSQDWISKNLTTYDKNPGAAATLMQDAGYSKDGGQWVDSDGEALTLRIATDSTAPRWEPTVASQLSEFGVETAVKTLSENSFKEKVKQGEFPMWASGGENAKKAYCTSRAYYTLLLWYDATRRAKQHGIYPDRQFKGGFSREGKPVPLTENRYKIFTIQAPPVGQPDAPLQKYHPASLALAFFTNPPEDEFRRRINIALWLANRFVPTVPINKTLEQHFIDDTHWQWPNKTPSWKNFIEGGPRRMPGILASGTIRANPDNPEKQA